MAMSASRKARVHNMTLHCTDSAKLQYLRTVQYKINDARAARKDLEMYRTAMHDMLDNLETNPKVSRMQHIGRTAEDDEWEYNMVVNGFTAGEKYILWINQFLSYLEKTDSIWRAISMRYDTRYRFLLFQEQAHGLFDDVVHDLIGNVDLLVQHLVTEAKVALVGYEAWNECNEWETVSSSLVDVSANCVGGKQKLLVLQTQIEDMIADLKCGPLVRRLINVFDWIQPCHQEALPKLNSKYNTWKILIIDISNLSELDGLTRKISNDIREAVAPYYSGDDAVPDAVIQDVLLRSDEGGVIRAELAFTKHEFQPLDRPATPELIFRAPHAARDTVHRLFEFNGRYDIPNSIFRVEVEDELTLLSLDKWHVITRTLQGPEDLRQVKAKLLPLLKEWQIRGYQHTPDMKDTIEYASAPLVRIDTNLDDICQHFYDFHGGGSSEFEFRCMPAVRSEVQKFFDQHADIERATPNSPLDAFGTFTPQMVDDWVCDTRELVGDEDEEQVKRRLTSKLRELQTKANGSSSPACDPIQHWQLVKPHGNAIFLFYAPASAKWEVEEFFEKDSDCRSACVNSMVRDCMYPHHTYLGPVEFDDPNTRRPMEVR